MSEIIVLPVNANGTTERLPLLPGTVIQAIELHPNLPGNYTSTLRIDLYDRDTPPTSTPDSSLISVLQHTQNTEGELTTLCSHLVTQMYNYVVKSQVWVYATVADASGYLLIRCKR